MAISADIDAPLDPVGLKSKRNTDKSAHLAPDPCYITTCPTIFLKKIGGHFKTSSVRLCAPSWSTALETDGTFRVPLLIALFIAIITCVKRSRKYTKNIGAILLSWGLLAKNSSPILTPGWPCNVRERWTRLFATRPVIVYRNQR